MGRDHETYSECTSIDHFSCLTSSFMRFKVLETRLWFNLLESESREWTHLIRVPPWLCIAEASQFLKSKRRAVGVKQAQTGENPLRKTVSSPWQWFNYLETDFYLKMYTHFITIFKNKIPFRFNIKWCIITLPGHDMFTHGKNTNVFQNFDPAINCVNLGK